MKKILAVLLSVLCIFSAVSTTAFAATDNIIGEVVEDYLGVTEEDGIDQQMMYGIHYEMEPITLVSVMYKPNPSITFDQPMITKVTKDTPISIDYEFLYWRHGETGEIYYPGDSIEVTGKVTLYAVWQEKTDNYPQFIRAMMAGFETLSRLIQKFLGIVEAVEESESEYYATTTMPDTTA
ncbi:MAG: hypothetical protein IJ491_10090 [Clostridia bacterium]|nr:hypothetical protein [Clostridia bacterium]